jgi:hypothetical protein
MTYCNARVLAIFLSCGLLAVCAKAQQPDTGTQSKAAPSAPATQNVNADAALMKDFNDRIEKFMALHDKKEKGKADPKETSDAGKIKATQDELAARIIAGRPDAKHGDIFTPEIQQLFRRLMYPELKQADAPQTKQTIKEDGPPPPRSKTLKVNARFPEGQPLPTVPPNLLARLPKLPEDLEYRFLDKDLILRDVDANLIVDYIPNAIR